ncbi:ABC transporter substrate-binding protein [Alicyclobacillus vulcanalis]|nr:extracellular solute-binding protein [Alicyclobacillus vulcanalis]
MPKKYVNARKAAFAAGASIVFLGAATGCGSTAGSKTQAASTAASKKNYVITIQLQPNTGTATSSQNKPFYELTQRYHKLHPNVTFKFIPDNYTDIGQANAALITEAAAHSAPDIVWEQYGPVNSGSIPNGVLTNLYPYLNEPDPYVKGNKRWIDLWKPQYIPYMTKAPGQIYILLGSAIATAIVYNKQDFQKAHITTVPTTFAQWVDDMKKLKAAGITPFMFATAGQCNPSWFERKIASSFLAYEIPKFDVNNSQVVTGLDIAVGVKKGIISMKNPQYAAGWKLLEQLKPYLAPGSSQYDVCAQLNSVSPPLSPLPAFVQNKFAMMWVHTGLLPQLNSLGFAGKYGFFSFPTITKASSPYATGVNVRGVVGGPNGSGEWSVTSQAADSSMTPDKVKQVVDFLMYAYAPQNEGAWVASMGNDAYIPIIEGASGGGIPGTQALLPQGKTIPKTVDSIINDALTVQAHDQAERILQDYVSGGISFNQFANEWDSMLQQATVQWAQQNGVNLNKYVK